MRKLTPLELIGAILTFAALSIALSFLIRNVITKSVRTLPENVVVFGVGVNNVVDYKTYFVIPKKDGDLFVVNALEMEIEDCKEFAHKVNDHGKAHAFCLTGKEFVASQYGKAL